MLYLCNGLAGMPYQHISNVDIEKAHIDILAIVNFILHVRVPYRRRNYFLVIDYPHWTYALLVESMTLCNNNHRCSLKGQGSKTYARYQANSSLCFTQTMQTKGHLTYVLINGEEMYSTSNKYYIPCNLYMFM